MASPNPVDWSWRWGAEVGCFLLPACSSARRRHYRRCMPALGPPQDDGVLFAQFRDDGDRDALATVYDRTLPRLRRFAARLVRDGESADDVVQATFLAAMRYASRYDARRPLQSWLCAILRNEARRRHRLVGPERERVERAVLLVSCGLAVG